MAQLTVRNVDEDIAAALKERARRAGRSAEAEHRRILQAALIETPATDFFDEAARRRVRLREVDTGTLLSDDRNR
ncbi:hypothetical protein PARPLA_03291 [Rhodobacteraceae bacterium THAF1]|uniref:FitA-like ribbon-helix-helix domain-containing protein n=1 Tax=Palleronia sp. THAF1 TaxID=2587842 RepID=UPI000F403CA7|nr:hypothetical protein [Palleronia sp. THAF1]QFU10374.1 hypothetical protein FIU81_16955 [Palleronia sp. THAF1]VDC31401.1 hypothetical protein PARPLA_03291 [Rhodobacteraceae bacterium THAF1]